MREDDIDLAVKQIRLRQALEGHVAESEEVPPEVLEAVREMFQERRGE